MSLLIILALAPLAALFWQPSMSDGVHKSRESTHYEQVEQYIEQGRYGVAIAVLKDTGLLQEIRESDAARLYQVLQRKKNETMQSASALEKLLRSIK